MQPRDKLNIYPVCDLSGRWGCINSEGSIVIEPRYEYCSRMQCSRLVVSEKGRYGVIDNMGHQIIKPKYKELDDFSESYAAFVRARPILGAVHGYVDVNGFENILPSGWKMAKFINGHAAVEREGQYGLMDLSGNIVIPFAYSWLGPVSDSLLCYRDGDCFGILKVDGRILTPPCYSWAWGFSDELCLVGFGGKYQFIDKQGNRAFGGKFFENAYEFSEGLAPACNEEGKWGHIDKCGDWVIAPVFTDVLPFSEGLSAVCMEGKREGRGDVEGGVWGFIDSCGKYIILPQYAAVESFSGGLARYGTVDQIILGNYGYINTNGEKIWPNNRTSQRV
jgi:hypothetical protein